MNEKERIERIWAWQLLHNKNLPATSMAMSVALLLSACGGGSSGDASTESKPLDFSLYHNYSYDNSLKEGEYFTVPFKYPVTVIGSPEYFIDTGNEKDSLSIPMGRYAQEASSQSVIAFSTADEDVIIYNDVRIEANMTEAEMVQPLTFQGALDFSSLMKSIDQGSFKIHFNPGDSIVIHAEGRDITIESDVVFAELGMEELREIGVLDIFNEEEATDDDDVDDGNLNDKDNALGDGSLGTVVEVDAEAGKDIQIRSLHAIEAASYPDGDTLVIDRAGVREYLNAVEDFSGIIGSISCDEFGDCDSQRIFVIENNPDDYEFSVANVVYEYEPW